MMDNKLKYLVLLGETIQKINEIDNQISNEPLWYLDMMELKRHLTAKLDHYISYMEDSKP
jgi:hypothetical protein